MNQGNCTAKTVKYQHLTEAERKIIERQTELGTPKRQIARLLGRNISTVRREIKRGQIEISTVNSKAKIGIRLNAFAVQRFEKLRCKQCEHPIIAYYVMKLNEQNTAGIHCLLSRL